MTEWEFKSPLSHHSSKFHLLPEDTNLQAVDLQERTIMEVRVEDVSSVKKILHIEIPAEEVVKRLDESYRELQKTAKIKGFRPGKVPRSILERMYQKDVHADVTSKLIDESYAEALKKTALEPIEPPKLDPPVLNPQAPFQYNVAFEIKPSIPDIDYKGLKLKKYRYQISEEEVDAQLKVIQKNLARYEVIQEKRPIREGDHVVIDYEGFKDGQPFEETQRTENFILKIGRGTISKEFDQALIGMFPEEKKEILVKFPESYPNSKLAGVEINFHVLVKEIREEILPPIDDAFASQLGEFKTLDELKAKIRENLKQGYDKRVEQELNEQIFSQLLEKVSFEVPDILIEHQLNSIISEFEQALAYHNKTMESEGLTVEELKNKYRYVALNQVRRFLILDKIIEQENLTVSEEESESKVNEIANIIQLQKEEVSKFYKENPMKFAIMKQSMLERKAIELILNNSIIEEVDIPSNTTDSIKDASGVSDA